MHSHILFYSVLRICTENMQVRYFLLEIDVELLIDKNGYH